MASACGNCKQQTTRKRSTFDDRGTVVVEICPQCSPDDFRDSPFRDPSDAKIYSGPQAMPNLYKRDREGVYHAKDELIADTAALWDEGPTARALRLKRQSRRTEPLTAHERAQSDNWGNEVLRPAVAKHGVAGALAVLNHR
jgi:hypothetical protein